MKRHDAMMGAFKKFSERMTKRYAEVSDCLNARRYEEAEYLLSRIAESHARTSLSLRNYLVRQGLGSLTEDNK